ncbi:MAG: hypothetical protein NW207_09340 [Cytophagales bacterium]|nr:hypothetical protein [Cytophagales bacterium]
MMKYKILFALVIFAIFSKESYSQTTQGRKLYAGATKSRTSGAVPISRKIAYKWTWMGGLGYTVYYGQLAKPLKSATDFGGISDLNIFIGLRYRINSRIMIGGSIRYLQMSGSDKGGDKPLAEGGAGRYERNLSFTTTGPEIQIFGEFDILPVISRWMGDKVDQYNRRNPILPYVQGGIGLFLFTPKATLDGTTYNLRELKTDDYKAANGAYSSFTPIISYGVGVRIKLIEFLDLGIDATVNKTFTDYLDDVKGGTRYYISDDSKTNGSYNVNTNQWTITDYQYYKSNASKDELLSNRSSELTNADGTQVGRASANALRSGVKDITDTYFMLNFRIDYTLSHVFMFHNPQHRHFSKGKGTKHHHFKRR